MLTTERETVEYSGDLPATEAELAMAITRYIQARKSDVPYLHDVVDELIGDMNATLRKQHGVEIEQNQ